MNNYTLNTADRLTHIKIVAVSLIAGIAVSGPEMTIVRPKNARLAASSIRDD